jgi:3-deoxy-D-manno-octulosonic-acid transferase/heptosyltransferase-1
MHHLTTESEMILKRIRTYFFGDMNDRSFRILIIKMSAIGDVVHSLHFLEALMGRYPNATIDWFVEKEASDLILDHRGLDRIFVSPRKEWGKRLIKGKGRLSAIGEAVGLLRLLRERKYDLVIDLQGLLRSGIVTGLSRGKRKIGMSGSREGAHRFWSEEPVPVGYDQHAIDRYLQFARHLDCDTNTTGGTIPVSDSDRKSLETLLISEGLNEKPFVAVNPMAGWKTKLWLPERFAALADRIIKELSLQVVFTGSKHDIQIIESIKAGMEEQSFNLAGKTSLKELSCLYLKSRALITTDTGPMHIAASSDCRVVALFGPTSPTRTGPYGKGHYVIQKHMDCVPCFKKSCAHTDCMSHISVEEVFEAVKDITYKGEESALKSRNAG